MANMFTIESVYTVLYWRAMSDADVNTLGTFLQKYYSYQTAVVYRVTWFVNQGSQSSCWQGFEAHRTTRQPQMPKRGLKTGAQKIEWRRIRLTNWFGQTYWRLSLLRKFLKSVTDDLKLPFDHRGLTGLYPRLNGWNTYAPMRPWLVKSTPCENWSSRHIWSKT